MPGIGPTLRDARIRARIDMAEVEARTKIRAKYLRAIENEEWHLLPGPVYTRSFLRTYSDYLGLDSRMLVEEFKRRHEQPAEPDPHPVAQLRQERGTERGPRPPLRVPLRRKRGTQRGPHPPLKAPPWATAVAALVVVVAALFLVGKLSNQNNNARQTGARHKHPGQRHNRTHTTANVTPAKPRTVTLQLVATAPVYVCIINGSGKKLIPGIIYDVGQTIPTETARELYLTLGNANAQMKVNGKSITVSPSPNPLFYRIRPRGTATVPSGTEPTCT